MTDQKEKSLKFAVDSELDDLGSDNEGLSRQFNKFELLDLVDNQKDPFDEGSTQSLLNEEDNLDIDANEDSNTKQLDCKPPNKSSKNRRCRKKGRRAVKTTNSVDLDLELIHNTQTVGKKGVEEISLPNETHFHLLKLDPRHLIPENELKRMFGKSVLKEERAKESKSRFHHSNGQVRSRFISSGIPDVKNAIITSIPKMELDELFNKPQEPKKAVKLSKSTSSSTSLDDKRPIYFKFVHEKSYQVAHNFFLDAAQRGYSEAIIQNLNLFPTHVESLVQLSDMIRVTEDYKAASELIERALLIFERGFHQQFNIVPGNCRLSYRRPENRTFFITIFKHIIYINRRGLRRTPLEYSKFLLSLDPENDPLFSSLLIDFYAIRSEEYDFIIEFISKWRNLAKLPNMNFSLALAHFMKSRSSRRGKKDSETSSTLADDLIQEALIRYPNFIIQLLDACSAEPSSSMLSCDYFNYTVYGPNYKSVPESVNLLVSLYVERNLVLWKTKEVLAWLERNITTLVEKFEKKELTNNGQHLDYWASFRTPLPRNLLRHIVLSEMKVKVPSSATSSSILDIDPYPPNESIISYRRDESSSIGAQSSDSHHVGLPTLFIRSFLPSFSLGGESNRNQAES